MAVTFKRAMAYKDNTMYKDSEGMDDLFDGTQEVYNPVSKLLLTLENLVTKGMNFSNSSEAQNRIIEILKLSNNFDEKIGDIISYEILLDRYWIELVNIEDKELINLIDETMVKKVVKVGDEIRYIQFTGVDAFGEAVEKEYYWNTEGEANRIVEKRKSGTIQIPMDTMRLIQRDSKYKIESLLNKIDKVNEYRYFIYNMGKTNGDPLLFLKLIDRLTPEEQEILRTEKYKDNTRTIAANDVDAAISYIELSGKMIPALQKEINDFKGEIADDYPETNMAEIFAAANVSEESLIIKMSDLDAKVKSLRSFLNRVVNFIFSILAGEPIIIGFEPIMQESNKEKVKQIRELKAEGLLDRETAIEMLAEIGFINDAQAVLTRLVKEEQDSLTGGDPYTGAFPNVIE